MRVSMEWSHLGHFQLLSRAVSSFPVVAEMEVDPQEDMADPQGTKVFAIERHGLPEDSVSFRYLCRMQSSPLVFAPNRAVVWGPLQWQQPKETLCFRFARF